MLLTTAVPPIATNAQVRLAVPGAGSQPWRPGSRSPRQANRRRPSRSRHRTAVVAPGPRPSTGAAVRPSAIASRFTSAATRSGLVLQHVSAVAEHLLGDCITEVPAAAEPPEMRCTCTTPTSSTRVLTTSADTAVMPPTTTTRSTLLSVKYARCGVRQHHRPSSAASAGPSGTPTGPQMTASARPSGAAVGPGLRPTGPSRTKVGFGPPTRSLPIAAAVA